MRSINCCNQSRNTHLKHTSNFQFKEDFSELARSITECLVRFYKELKTIISQSDSLKSSFLIATTSEEKNFRKIDAKAIVWKNWRIKSRVITSVGRRLNTSNSCSICEFIRKSFFSGTEKNRKIEKRWPIKPSQITTLRRRKSK